MPLASAARITRDSFAQGLRPDPLLSVWEWADLYRMLSSKGSAEPGRYRTSRFPFVREIMGELSPSSKVQKVVFMKGSQVGGSEVGNNFMGYVIDYAPGPMLLVQPNLGLAKKYSKQRIKPLIDETPRLKEKMLDGGESSLFENEFRGGIVVIGGANSAASLCSMPAKYIFLDEIDRYPDDVDGEGDPIALAEARARNFKRKKVYLVSTPVLDSSSKIAAAYEESDQRHYHVPCPHCGQYQWLKWSQIKYEKKLVAGKLEPINVRYICEHCNGEIREHHKTKMLTDGKWIADRPGAGGGLIAGFHLSALYSPVGMYSWEDAAREYVRSEGNPQKEKAFTNTVLGETWKNQGDAPEWERIYERREFYPINRVPKPVMFLVCGADVQRDRIEVEVVGYGKDLQSWSIDYRVFEGDTSVAGSEPWKKLDKLLMEEWPHESGISIPIYRLAIDSGFNTQRVYNWARRYYGNRVMAVKGKARAVTMVSAPSVVDLTSNGKRMKRGFKVWHVGVGIAKSELYSWLKLMKPTDGNPYPPGYCHFPEYGEDYFKQLTAEQLVVTIEKRKQKEEWVKIRDRNEALDCRVYARAAAFAVGIDKFTEAHWEQFQIGGGITVLPPADSAPAQEAPVPQRDPNPRRDADPPRRSSYLRKRY